MTVVAQASSMLELGGGGHVCWVVGDDEGYAEVANAFLADGAAAGRKTVVFGPETSEILVPPTTGAALVADPRVAFLDRGPLDPSAMFSMFREQSAEARAEGHTGLCLVADMDWLLPARPSVEAVVDFELHLDRVVAELDAVVVCAYRPSSFDADAIAGVLSVHPVEHGDCEPPPFRLVAGEDGCWQLSGEVDLATESAFALAFTAAVSEGRCIVDVRGLDFIDVRGLRVIAESSRTCPGEVQLRGAAPLVRRMWDLTGFARVAPQVSVTA